MFNVLLACIVFHAQPDYKLNHFNFKNYIKSANIKNLECFLQLVEVLNLSSYAKIISEF